MDDIINAKIEIATVQNIMNVVNNKQELQLESTSSEIESSDESSKKEIDTSKVTNIEPTSNISTSWADMLDDQIAYSENEEKIDSLIPVEELLQDIENKSEQPKKKCKEVEEITKLETQTVPKLSSTLNPNAKEFIPGSVYKNLSAEQKQFWVSDVPFSFISTHMYNIAKQFEKQVDSAEDGWANDSKPIIISTESTLNSSTQVCLVEDKELVTAEEPSSSEATVSSITSDKKETENVLATEKEDTLKSSKLIESNTNILEALKNIDDKTFSEIFTSNFPEIDEMTVISIADSKPIMKFNESNLNSSTQVYMIEVEELVTVEEPLFSEATAFSITPDKKETENVPVIEKEDTLKSSNVIESNTNILEAFKNTDENTFVEIVASNLPEVEETTIIDPESILGLKLAIIKMRDTSTFAETISTVSIYETEKETNVSKKKRKAQDSPSKSVFANALACIKKIFLRKSNSKKSKSTSASEICLPDVEKSIENEITDITKLTLDEDQQSYNLSQYMSQDVINDPDNSCSDSILSSDSVGSKFSIQHQAENHYNVARQTKMKQRCCIL